MSSLLLCLLSLMILGCASFGAEPAHVNAQGAAKLIAEGKVIVLDVRTPKEFTAGHIDGAKNIDYNASDFESKVAALEKTKPYLVHCASGGRSSRSLKVFAKLGFTQITHLDGGMNAWTAAGEKVVK